VTAKPTISDIADAADGTADVLQRIIARAGSDARVPFILIHTALLELSVLTKTIGGAIDEAKREEILTNMARVNQGITAHVNSALDTITRTKGISEHTRLGVLAAADKARYTSSLVRAYITNAIADAAPPQHRRKEDSP